MPSGAITAAISVATIRRWLARAPALLVLLQLINQAQAQTKTHANEGAPTQQAIDRGLVFLARDAVAWNQEHHCASCHHAALIVWAMNEAKARGHTTDESVRSDLTRALAEVGDGKTSLPRPPGIPRALNTKALYFALGLGSVGHRTTNQSEALNRLVETVKADQTDAGYWAAWPGSLPPIFGQSNERMTLLANLALLPAANAGDLAAKRAINDGVAWLKATRSDQDPQATALRLVLWTRLGRPRSEGSPLVRRIRSAQKPDGGWSQTAKGPSDAWATGQALYALSLAAKSECEPTLYRGRAFLIRSQRADGSWPMLSRSDKPGEKAAESAIPITGAGSAWAVIGLVNAAN